MPHTPPPPRESSVSKISKPVRSKKGMPIRLKGELNKITIERPYFFDQDTTSTEQITAEFNVSKITTTNRQGPGNDQYKSTAKQIVVKIDGIKVLAADIPNGDFTVEVHFDHPTRDS